MRTPKESWQPKKENCLYYAVIEIKNVYIKEKESNSRHCSVWFGWLFEIWNLFICPLKFKLCMGS